MHTRKPLLNPQAGSSLYFVALQIQSVSKQAATVPGRLSHSTQSADSLLYPYTRTEYGMRGSDIDN
jgi:hypothetical protein